METEACASYLNLENPVFPAISGEVLAAEWGESMAPAKCSLCQRNGKPCWLQDVKYDKHTCEPYIGCGMGNGTFRMFLTSMNEDYTAEHMAWLHWQEGDEQWKACHPFKEIVEERRKRKLQLEAWRRPHEPKTLPELLADARERKFLQQQGSLGI